MTELTLAGPFITKSIFERSFQSLNNLSLLEILSWLSNVELLLVISVYRLTVIKNMKYDVTIGNIFDEFEKIFYFGSHIPTTHPHNSSNKDVHVKDLFHALNVLISLDLVSVSRYANRSDHAYKQITKQHLVQLVPMLSEFKNAFRLDDDQVYDSTDMEAVNTVPIIKVIDLYVHIFTTDSYNVTRLLSGYAEQYWNHWRGSHLTNIVHTVKIVVYYLTHCTNTLNEPSGVPRAIIFASFLAHLALIRGNERSPLCRGVTQ